MMVRFSDIIDLKGRKSPDAPQKRVPTVKREDSFRLSDARIFSPRDREQVIKDADIPKKKSPVEVSTYYEIFIERAQEIKQKVQGDKGISPSPILSDLHSIIDKNLIDNLYGYAMSAKDDHEELLIHTVDVTFTCLKIGRGLNYDMKNLLRLGLAAFLENVGMYKIPDNILAIERRLTEGEVNLIRKHPETSYEILITLGERYRWLAEAALHIHERADGSGYPSGMKGDEIPELSSIIGLVDTYVAMIKNRPYREKFIQTDAIKSIVEAGRGKFLPGILKIFLNQISLFPVNSYVKLNNGVIGRVVSTNKDQPLRPTIEPLYDGSDKQVKNKNLIHLADNPLLYIDGSVGSDTLP